MSFHGSPEDDITIPLPAELPLTVREQTAPSPP